MRRMQTNQDHLYRLKDGQNNGDGLSYGVWFVFFHGVVIPFVQVRAVLTSFIL
jgi:hypothetical protein